MPFPPSIGRRLRPPSRLHAHEMGQPRYLAIRRPGKLSTILDRQTGKCLPVGGSHVNMTLLAAAWNRDGRGEE